MHEGAKHAVHNEGAGAHYNKEAAGTSGGVFWPLTLARKGERIPLRARGCALVLGILCIACWPYSVWHADFGAAQPIMGTLFTLIFVASALFLLAGNAVLGAVGGWPGRPGVWLAPLLLLMYGRYYLDGIGKTLSLLLDRKAFNTAAESAMLLVTLLAGVVLVLLALQPWHEMLAKSPADLAPAAACVARTACRSTLTPSNSSMARHNRPSIRVRGGMPS